VRFAAHHGFRPDFCEAADPESKGIVENLVGYAKTDLMIPGMIDDTGGSGEPFTDHSRQADHPPATQDYADIGELLTALTSGPKTMVGITRTSA